MSEIDAKLLLKELENDDNDSNRKEYFNELIEIQKQLKKNENYTNYYLMSKMYS